MIMIGDDTLTLKVYVKPGNPELLAKYKELSVAHNQKLETSMYSDSGFDLLIPCNYWEDDVSYLNNYLSENTFKLPLSIKCSFVNDTRKHTTIMVFIHKDISDCDIKTHFDNYNGTFRIEKEKTYNDCYMYIVCFKESSQSNNYVRENNGRPFSDTYQHLPPIQVLMKYYGYYLYPRSSIVKTSMRLANSVGIIDSGYRGEIMAVVDKHGTSNDWKTVLKRDCKQYDRLFQICAGNLKPFRVEIVDNESELSSMTERGCGGFGSTGR